jgi:hypothetical protein
MIGNEHQSQISRKQLAYLRQVRASYEATPQPESLTQAALLASEDTLIGDIEAEIAEYEALVVDDTMSPFGDTE